MVLVCFVLVCFEEGGLKGGYAILCMHSKYLGNNVFSKSLRILIYFKPEIELTLIALGFVFY